jgi:hypothetical protein
LPIRRERIVPPLVPEEQFQPGRVNLPTFERYSPLTIILSLFDHSTIRSSFVLQISPSRPL